MVAAHVHEEAAWIRRSVSVSTDYEHVEQSGTEGIGWKQYMDSFEVRSLELVEAVRSTGYQGEVHIVHLHEVYCSGSHEERFRRLVQLLRSVSDETGRQDLVQYLRWMLLLRIAGALLQSSGGCNKLAVGDTLTSLAVRVIAETAKVGENQF
jgi:hypothetical protein